MTTRTGLTLSLEPYDPRPDDLAGAWADIDQWLDQHPCDCEALCACEDDG